MSLSFLLESNPLSRLEAERDLEGIPGCPLLSQMGLFAVAVFGVSPGPPAQRQLPQLPCWHIYTLVMFGIQLCFRSSVGCFLIVYRGLPLCLFGLGNHVETVVLMYEYGPCTLQKAYFLRF